MINIKKLARPNKRSGHLLEKGKSTKVKGVTITNTDGVPNLYVDRYQRKK